MDDALIGTWLLAAHHTEDTATGARTAMFGDAATGVLAIQSDGRMIAVITGADGGTPGPAILAYSGRYRIEPGRLITAVDIAWLPAWVGTEQVRWFTVDGDRLDLTTSPLPRRGETASAAMIGVMSWTRETVAGGGASD